MDPLVCGMKGWKDQQDKGAFMWRRETSHIDSSGLGYDAALSACLVCWRASAPTLPLRKEMK